MRPRSSAPAPGAGRRGVGLAANAVQQLLADLVGVAPHGQLQVALVTDDVVLRAPMDRTHRDHGRVDRIDSRLTIVCSDMISWAACTIGSIVVCGYAP